MNKIGLWLKKLRSFLAGQFVSAIIQASVHSSHARDDITFRTSLCSSGRYQKFLSPTRLTQYNSYSHHTSSNRELIQFNLTFTQFVNIYLHICLYFSGFAATNSTARPSCLFANPQNGTATLPEPNCRFSGSACIPRRHARRSLTEPFTTPLFIFDDTSKLGSSPIRHA
jgi:hypothetical protein